MGSLFNQPPSPVWSALSLVRANEKPRSRSEWENLFTRWQRPASDTEEAKIEAASARVKRALSNNDFLQSRDWKIIPQGSYANNTNVRADSDVDLAVCLTGAIFFEGQPPDVLTREDLGFVPLSFTFSDFKNEIAKSMVTEFGPSNVQRGNKAIHLNKDTEGRVSVDVVPTFTFQLYNPRVTVLSSPALKATGIGLDTDQGERKTNFPELHYINGCAKNDRTGRRFKRVVRILKNLRNHVAGNTTVEASIRNNAGQAASYLIECLVYNCPDRLFGNSSIYDDVSAVLRYMAANFSQSAASGMLLGDGNPYALWKEVNGVKDLFRVDQAWTAQDAEGFALAALIYMES